MVHDSELVGILPALKPDLRGTSWAPKAVIPNPKANDGWQIGATYMENGQQLVFVNERAPVKGSIYGTYTGRSVIVIMSLASGTPTFSSLVDVPTDPKTQWGNTLFQSRRLRLHLRYRLQYDDGCLAWVEGRPVCRSGTLSISRSGPTGMDRVGCPESPFPRSRGSLWSLNGVIPLKGGSGFMGVGTGGSGSNYSVYLTFSCSPTGPVEPGGSTSTSIPKLPASQNEIAYMATFHPELKRRRTRRFIQH